MFVCVCFYVHGSEQSFLHRAVESVLGRVHQREALGRGGGAHTGAGHFHGYQVADIRRHIHTASKTVRYDVICVYDVMLCVIAMFCLIIAGIRRSFPVFGLFIAKVFI